MENIEIELDIKDIYTPLHIAKEEIHRRWNDIDLKKKMKDSLGGKIPDVFKDKPKAIIFRNIATPNLEIGIAHEYAQMMGLDLVVIEYTADKFCTRNRDKLHLGKMVFVHKDNKSQIVSKEKIIDIKEDDNKRLSDISTLWGEKLVDFHKRIFKENGYGHVETFDASIYKDMGLSPHEIYLKILGFSSCFAVLLENFLVKTDPGEKRFTNEVIWPAFKAITAIAGVQPLIIPLITSEEDEGVNWQCYSGHMRDCAKQCTDI